MYHIVRDVNLVKTLKLVLCMYIVSTVYSQLYFHKGNFNCETPKISIHENCGLSNLAICQI